MGTLNKELQVEMRHLLVLSLLSVASAIQVSESEGQNGATARFKSAGAQRSSPLSAWTALLQKHVKANAVANGIHYSQVNYTGLARDREEFDNVISALTASNVVALDRNQTLTFYLNAYNALILRTILKAPCYKTMLRCQPIHSIREIGTGPLTGHKDNVWKQTAGIIGGRKYSLKQVRDALHHPAHKFKPDMRILAAMSSAAVSSADLRSEAYDPEKIDAQLDAQMAALLANERKGFRLDRKERLVTLSPLFQEFKVVFHA